MIVHYCQEFGWQVESCPSTCCGDPHFSLHVGFEGLCLLLNNIDALHDTIRDNRNPRPLLKQIRKWMGTHDAD